MDTQTARDTFGKVQRYYKSILYPKYKNVNLEELKNNYDALIEIKGLFYKDVSFIKLINAMSQILARLENKIKLSKLSKDQIWSNLSERGMNKAIPPAHKRNQDKTTLPVEWTDQWGNACYLSNGSWDAKNYMVMDVIGYLWLLKQGGDSLPEETTPLFSDLDGVISMENELNNTAFKTDIKGAAASGVCETNKSTSPFSVSFDDRYFKRCTGHKMSSNEILNLLLETTRVEFKLCFPIRLKETGNKEVVHKMSYYSRFFELAVEEEKTRKDGIVQRRRYRVYFTTLLGQLFINNLAARFNDKLDIRFYTLPESAQIFYRKALLHHNYKRTEMNREKIADVTGLKDQNRTNLSNTIERNILDPLKQMGLIDSFEKTEGMKDMKYIIIRKDMSS